MSLAFSVSILGSTKAASFFPKVRLFASRANYVAQMEKNSVGVFPEYLGGIRSIASVADFMSLKVMESFSAILVGNISGCWAVFEDRREGGEGYSRTMSFKVGVYI